MKTILLLNLSVACLIWAKPSLRSVVPRVTKIVHGGSRIIGGEVANAGDWPFMAAIFKHTPEGRYFCAGSLINDQWVLTAAQCTDGATQFVIQLGSNHIEGDDPNRLTVAAEEYFLHRNWNASILWTDIALIKLRMPIEFTEYIQPIEYVTNMGYVSPGRVFDMAGWGQTSDEEGGIVNELRTVEVTIVANVECQTYYGSQLFPSMQCAKGNYNEGICYGDVGGALITPINWWLGNHSIAVLVASFLSPNGCESTDPQGYTRIDAYWTWIRDTIRDN